MPSNSYFLSGRAQSALLVLGALSRECWRRGEGIGKAELSRISGIAVNILTDLLALLLRAGLVKYEKRKLYPDEKLFQKNLYDLIIYTDGWVHIGNAHFGEISSEPFYASHIQKCQNALRGGVEEYLRSIDLLSLIPECGDEGGFLDSIIRQFSNGIKLQPDEIVSA